MPWFIGVSGSDFQVTEYNLVGRTSEGLIVLDGWNVFLIPHKMLTGIEY